ncbi:hypothetical protein HD554DRAFT_2011317 [Boletus coccyginus]|nr:hypothetical protein HD554DRAFT_2011317 [Boletus coccyginus]
MTIPSLDPSEIPYVPPPRMASYYLALLCVVLPVWLVTPFSWSFVIYTIYNAKLWSYGWNARLFFAVALCEVLFSVHHYNLVRSVSGLPQRSPNSAVELQTGFERVLKTGLADLTVDEESLDVQRPGSPAEHLAQLQPDDPRAIEFRAWMRAWFRRTTWSSIRKQDVYAYLYWAFHNSPLPITHLLPDHHRDVLDRAIRQIENRAGVAIPDGPSSGVSPILLTIDKLNVTSRPFVWYAMVLATNWMLRRWLERVYSVRFGRYGGLEYCIRIPESWDPVRGCRPIVLFHGLGIGLMQYKLLIDNLLRNFSDRPVLIPIQPNISQDIFHSKFLKPMNRHEMTAHLSGLLRELGWVSSNDPSLLPLNTPSQGIVILSHSNGSFLHAWFLKAYPEMVVRSCFVDPVTFCCWEGDMCYNFLYSRCSTGLDLLMRYFVGTELGIANTIQRHFDWSSNSLWFEEIPNARDSKKMLVVLGGKDVILNAERVRRYLGSHGVRKGICFDPNGSHGQPFVAGGPAHSAIMSWLKLA